MIRAYQEIIEFIAAGTTPSSVASYEASDASKAKIAEFIEREKLNGLQPDERSELDHYLQLEHLMRLAKAQARINASS